MDKKDKDNPLDDYEKLKDEIIIDQVNEAPRYFMWVSQTGVFQLSGR